MFVCISVKADHKVIIPFHGITLKGDLEYLTVTNLLVDIQDGKYGKLSFFIIIIFIFIKYPHSKVSKAKKTPIKRVNVAVRKTHPEGAIKSTLHT